MRKVSTRRICIGRWKRSHSPGPRLNDQERLVNFLSKLIFRSDGSGGSQRSSRRELRWVSRSGFTGVGSINAARSVFTLLTLQALDVLTVALDFGLVPVDLLLLPIIGVLMVLQLVADEGASTESQTTADGGSSSGMADGSTDESVRGCAAESANTSALLACA